MPAIKVKTNTKDFIRKLKKHHGGLAMVGADSVNTAAKLVKSDYNKRLDKFILRNKFTKGAVRIFKSRPQRGADNFRDIKDINAIVGVMKMKGGRDHYLLKQEIGDVKKGFRGTKSKVPIPLSTSRPGNQHRKPIKRALRLTSAPVQELKLGTKKFGSGSDGFSPRQRWAILYKYAGLSAADTSSPGNKYGWDLGKQFIFEGIKKGLGVFQLANKKFKMVRTLKKSSVVIKARHKFEKAVDKLTPQMMETIFKRSASRFLRK